MIKLHSGDKFYYATMEEFNRNIFPDQSKKAKPYQYKVKGGCFVPIPLKGTNYCVWCVTLFEDKNDCKEARKWISTINSDSCEIVKHYCYDWGNAPAYDTEYDSSNFLVFNKIKQKYFQFVGVYIEDDILETRGLFAGKCFKKISDTFILN